MPGVHAGGVPVVVEVMGVIAGDATISVAARKRRLPGEASPSGRGKTSLRHAGNRPRRVVRQKCAPHHARRPRRCGQPAERGDVGIAALGPDAGSQPARGTLLSPPCCIDRGGSGRRSDGDPRVDLGQVETERAVGSGADEANGPQLRIADLALDLGLRLMTRRALMNRGPCRKLGIPHEPHTITVAPRRLRCFAHRPVASAPLSALSLWPANSTNST